MYAVVKLARLAVGMSVTALAAAAFAPAKEGARAQLLTPLRLGAVPGTTIRVQWTVDTPDAKGVRRSFRANRMFVRAAYAGARTGTRTREVV